jgi:type VI secretion system protein ImpK
MPVTPGTGHEAGRESSSRRGQLALIFQEVLTAVARLRCNRQVASDAESFRTHVKQLLSSADRDGRRLGYASDDVALAIYAVVAFLDESVLNSSQPMFASWPSRPLQEEIFGGHMGGEIFFQHLRQLLGRQESEDLADLLEVFQLCLLLGFQGRYTAERGDLRAMSNMTDEKIRRIRGGFGELSSHWAPPSGEKVARSRDPWVRWLALGAVTCLIVAGLLFGFYRVSLDTFTRNSVSQSTQ